MSLSSNSILKANGFSALPRQTSFTKKKKMGMTPIVFCKPKAEIAPFYYNFLLVKNMLGVKEKNILNRIIEHSNRVEETINGKTKIDFATKIIDSFRRVICFDKKI